MVLVISKKQALGLGFELESKFESPNRVAISGGGEILVSDTTRGMSS